ncbi:uncharacterized protein L203_101721 [Cryptococcus depauperatus CBS 7841]|uniref:Uncharacterized protein n=1 Tax=Cryptococcus depauperatus CBS 7841 TaxID=1295531 RepID=A0A1E3HR22_9TREE|nr:hypothetical protein L203_06226 [Cryptococcus depauperatus CBS 7841]
MSTTTAYPTLRRIVTSHDPSDTTGAHVTFHDDEVSLKPVLDGNAHISSLYSSSGLPTINPHVVTSQHITRSVEAVRGVVFPGGSNAQVTQLAPNFCVDMHRTSSVDYNVMVQGSAWLIVPDGKGGENKTLVRVGELVVQTGTLHAWQAGPEGARWVTVVVEALPVRVQGNELENIDF